MRSPSFRRAVRYPIAAKVRPARIGRIPSSIVLAAQSWIVNEQARWSAILFTLFALLLGCSRSPEMTVQVPTPASLARSYVTAWAEMSGWLPASDIPFFTEHFGEVQGVLASALADPREEVRLRAAFIIGGIGKAAKSLELALVERFEAEPSRPVRLYLYDAICSIGAPKPSTLLALQKRFDQLGKSDEPLGPGRSYTAVDERIRLAAVLYRLDPQSNRRPEYVALVLEWLRPRPDDLAPNEAQAHLGHYGTAINVMEHMRDADTEIRFWCWAIMQRRRPKPFETNAADNTDLPVEKRQKADNVAATIQSLGGTVEVGKAKLTGEITDEEEKQGKLFRYVILESFWKGSDEDLALLRKLPNLVYLDTSRARIADGGMATILALTELEYLNLDRALLSDPGLGMAHPLKHLNYLSLRDTRTGDSGLGFLKPCTKIHTLFLDDTLVTDVGLVHLQQLTALSRLSLNGTGITDAGLEKLKPLTWLTFLSLENTRVTEVGVRRLQHAIPKARIVWSARQSPQKTRTRA